MSEEVVTFGSARSLVGILHRAAADNSPALPAVLLLNAGILHRVGPNRLYVRIAREMQHRGFDVLRFDLGGIGDSQNLNDEAGKTRTFLDDTVDAMNVLGERVGATRFMLMGICMGARIALEVARRDGRVESLALMEGIYVRSARYHVTRILDPGKWRRLLTGDSHLLMQVRHRLARRRNGTTGAGTATSANGRRPVLLLAENDGGNMRTALRALLSRGARILLVFRDGNEIAYNYRLRRSGDDIAAAGLPPGLEVAFVRFADHTFTPLISQDLLLGVTTRWLEGVYPAAR